MSKKVKESIRECLGAIGVDPSVDFEGCENLPEEFAKIKKAYYRKALATHPDKGGDAADFREVQISFEVLRDMLDKHLIDSFVLGVDKSVRKEYGNVSQDFSNIPTPSWEYFYTAAEESVPAYRVELAKSNRSACKQKGNAKKCHEEPPFIAKGEVRVGSFDKESGAYGRWMHVPCWRVPSAIWLGLPNPDTCQDYAQFEKCLLSMNEVNFCGFSDLSDEDRQVLVAHTMTRDNWAAKRKPKGLLTDGGDDTGGFVGNSSSGSSSSTAIVLDTSSSSTQLAAPARMMYVPPKPGVNGAVAGALAGKTVVLTGLFPELGGGTGLSLGKDRAKALVESFGGRVTGSVSGKTNILIVGKEPGMSKVSKARGLGVQLMDIKDLKEGLEGGSLDTVKPMVITEFSGGYMGSSTLALEATSAEYASAAGTGPAILNAPKIKAAKAPKEPKAKVVKVPKAKVPKVPKAKAPTKAQAKAAEAVAKAAEAVAKAASAVAGGAEAKEQEPVKSQAMSSTMEVEVVKAEEVKSEGMEGQASESTKKPRAKPPKKAAKPSPSTALTVKKQPKAKPSPLATAKKTKRKVGKVEWTISCDGCGVECGEVSWFLEETKQDFCGSCKSNEAVRMVKGEVVVKAKKAKA
ncbi:hypothetical protein B484DRAFT_398175 [Ochromonadaceae sp. CCMP2298]|nr:hypothetical protein B484DRAFT_398175 [Ochromonadaceae sp. CCMP2298]|mmetsp:Transcript_3080/g.7153  ORF Transcript_3080/g.7153 Transcript_3080/m.7153 type:complete len:632 (+) Transcript_3080:159-2054(+)